MSAPTLVWQLSRVQALVVAFACSLLVAGAMGSGALLLRRDQDASLRAEATSLCHALSHENVENHRPADDPAGAAEAFAEAAVDAFRYELRASEGAILAEEGQLPGWEGSSAGPVPGACLSTSWAGGWFASNRLRTCSVRCGRHAVSVSTADVLARPEARQAALGIFVALPLAVIVGAAIGVVIFRRLLRPLGALRRAASRLAPRPGVALGVAARPAELAALENAFDSLLSRLGEALARETRFTQEASHELRTPLTLLRGRLERLQREVEGRADLEAETGAALADLAALDRLVDALLVLARSESAGLPQTPVNICDLAREVAALQARADGPASRPPEVDAPDEILVRGSEELLQRALGNLVENSRKFGGRQARIRIRVRREDERGVICVEDDGPGIPEGLRPFAFERFVRGANDRHLVPGAGLGMALARSVVLRHGGEIRTGPASLGGEEVKLLLPLLEACGSRGADGPADPV